MFLVLVAKAPATVWKVKRSPAGKITKLTGPNVRSVERDLDDDGDSVPRHGGPQQAAGHAASSDSIHWCTAGGGVPLKVVLSFLDSDPRSVFHSESYRVPAGQRLWIREVSLFVPLGETTDLPPVKAFAYLTTGQIEFDESRRFNVHEPLGTIDWLDKSSPPFEGATLGMLRTTMSTFNDQFVSATLSMNERIELGQAAGDTPLTHATIVGCLVELPSG